MEEIWKPIKGYEGYEISSLGRVKSFKFKQELIRKPHLNKDGYLYVCFSNENKPTTLKIHRLVCEHFCNGKTEKRNIVDHIDDNKLNNIYTNLRWCSFQENIDFAWAIGIYNNIGQNHGMAKLNDESVKAIKILLNSNSITCKEIANRFKVTNWCIHDIKSNRTWKHITI